MSIIARLFLVLALLLGGVSIYFIKGITDDKQNLKAELGKAETSQKNTARKLAEAQALVKAKEDEVAKAQEETKKTTAQLTEATAKITAQTSDIEKLNKDIADLKAQPKVDDTAVNEAKQKLAAAEQSRDAASAQVKEASDKLKAKTDELAALSGEKKVLEDKLKQQTSKLLFMEGKEGWMMPLPEGLTAKVLFYDRSWNFVVLDCGKKKGAVENGVMILHRGTDILGPVRITTVDDDACIADYMGDFHKKDKEPRAGDTAMAKQ